MLKVSLAGKKMCCLEGSNVSPSLGVKVDIPLMSYMENSFKSIIKIGSNE